MYVCMVSKVYSGDGGVDIDLLERALTLVKRRSEAVERHVYIHTLYIEIYLNFQRLSFVYIHTRYIAQ